MGEWKSKGGSCCDANLKNKGWWRGLLLCSELRPASSAGKAGEVNSRADLVDIEDLLQESIETEKWHFYTKGESSQGLLGRKEMEERCQTF